MADYIIYNSAGKELRREPKGRGRPRTGAELLPDGNYKVIEDSPSVEEKPAAVSVVHVPPTEEEIAFVLESSEPVKGFKKYTAKRQLTLKAFLNIIHWSMKDYHEQQDGFQINRPDINWCREDTKKIISNPDDFGFSNCDFYSSFAKFVYNKINNELQVWTKTDVGSPDFVILNLING